MINSSAEKCAVFVVVFNKTKWLRKLTRMTAANSIVSRLTIANISIHLINTRPPILARITGTFVDVCRETDLIKIDGDRGAAMSNINYTNVNFNTSREGTM